MGKGLVYGVTHPVEFAKAVTNWEMWLDNPARALGQLVPEVALALATAGAGGAAKGAGAARRAARSADDLIASAAKAEKQVTPLLDEIARGEGAELVGLEHRLKKADSLPDKITRDAATEYAHLPVGEAASRTADGVKDVLRYTVQSERSRYADAYDA